MSPEGPRGASGPPTEWPSVSVVVPTRDRLALARRAIGAVLAQRYPGPIECLLVFDQSEPEPLDLPVPAGRSFRWLTNERAAGLAGARNSGAVRAEGELLAFCDDDDLWHPDKLRRQVELWARHPSASVAGSGIQISYGRRLIDRPLPQPVTTFRDLLRSRIAELHPSTYLVRRRDFLGPIGMVDEGIPGSYGEDYEWLLRAARNGPIVGPREPQVRVLGHEASFFARRWDTIIDALQYLLDRYPEFASEPEGLARIQGQLAFACAASGRREEGAMWARRSRRANPRERRGYLAAAVNLGVPPELITRLAHRVGKGI